jgi:hypothetical protein
MKKFAFVVVIVMALTGLAFANGGAETKEMRELPPGPAYASAAQPADSGQVKPIKASDEPIRIAGPGSGEQSLLDPCERGFHQGQ